MRPEPGAHTQASGGFRAGRAGFGKAPAAPAGYNSKVLRTPPTRSRESASAIL